jgi:hypothetical protein
MTTTRKTEETALATRKEESFELAPTSAAAEKQYEIQSAIMIAKNFRRDEDAAFEKLTRACRRTSFAEDASYSFPRGGTQIVGPSVNLAREAARAWENIRYGLAILHEDDESVLIQGWAWDLETNTKVSAEDRFKKLIQRRINNITKWVKPDERDLRELINRRGAIAVRNSLLQLLPKDLIEDAMRECAITTKERIAKDPDDSRKKIILAFSEFNIIPEMLEQYLGHPLKQATSEQIVELRSIYKSIKDGNSKWSEYVEEEKKGPEKGSLGLDDLKGDSAETAGEEATSEEPESESGEKPEETENSSEKVDKEKKDNGRRRKTKGKDSSELF